MCLEHIFFHTASEFSYTLLQLLPKIPNIKKFHAFYHHIHCLQLLRKYHNFFCQKNWWATKIANFSNATKLSDIKLCFSSTHWKFTVIAKIHLIHQFCHCYTILLNLLNSSFSINILTTCSYYKNSVCLYRQPIMATSATQTIRYRESSCFPLLYWEFVVTTKIQSLFVGV